MRTIKLANVLDARVDGLVYHLALFLPTEHYSARPAIPFRANHLGPAQPELVTQIIGHGHECHFAGNLVLPTVYVQKNVVSHPAQPLPCRHYSRSVQSSPPAQTSLPQMPGESPITIRHNDTYLTKFIQLPGYNWS